MAKPAINGPAIPADPAQPEPEPMATVEPNKGPN